MFGCSVEVWSNAKWKEKGTGNEDFGREKLKLCAGSCLDDKRKETRTQWTPSAQMNSDQHTMESNAGAEIMSAQANGFPVSTV